MATLAACAVQPDTEEKVGERREPLQEDVYFAMSQGPTWPPPLRINPNSNYYEFENRMFAGQVNGANPQMAANWFSDAVNYTGLNAANVTAALCSGSTCSMAERPSFIHYSTGSPRRIGMWLRPGSASTPSGADRLLSITPIKEWATPQAFWPGTSPSELSLRLFLQVPRLKWSSWTRVAHIIGYLLLVDSSTQQLVWYGVDLFDPRGFGEGVAWDLGTNLPIVGTHLASSGTQFGHKGATSFSSQTATWTGYRWFDWRVSRQELINGITALNAYRTQQCQSCGSQCAQCGPLLSTNPANYGVYAVVVSPEVAELDTTLYYAPGNGYANAVPMRIYFQTEDEPNWTVEKSVTVSVPANWGWAERTASFAGNPRWTGKITALSFNPTSPGGSGSFGFDFIRIGDNDRFYSANWDFKNLPSPLPNPIPCNGNSWYRYAWCCPWTDGERWAAILEIDPSLQVSTGSNAPNANIGLSLQDLSLVRVY